MFPVNWILQCGRESQWTDFCSFTPCREMTFVLDNIFSWEDQLLAYVTSSLPFFSDIFLKAYMDHFQYSVIQIPLLLIVWMCCVCENRNCSSVCVKVHLIFFLKQCWYAFLHLYVVCVHTHTYICLCKKLQWSFTFNGLALILTSPLLQIQICRFSLGNQNSRGSPSSLPIADGLRVSSRHYC